mgnify:FL=1
MKINIILILLFFPIITFAQENIDVLEKKADSLYDVKEYTSSLKIYNHLLVKKATNSYYLSKKGLCLFHLENYQSAKENFRLAALYENPENKKSLATHYSNLSACYSNLNEDKKAYDYAMKAYYIDENNPLTLWNAASLGNNVNEYEKGIEILDKSKIEKHNDFNALYGRAFLYLSNYNKSIEYYEKFFQNFDNDNRYAESVNLSDEKYNLLKAYMGLLLNNIENKVNEYRYEQQLLSLTKELSTTEWNKKIAEKILYLLDNTKSKNNPFTSMITKQFEMLPDRLPMESAIFYYRVKQYKKSQDLIEKIIKEEAFYTDTDANLGKMYHYLNELNLMLMNMNNQGETIDDKELGRTISYFRNYYADKKNLDYKSINTTEELFNPLLETLIILNSKSPYNKNKMKYVLTKIFENIPNETMKTEMLEMLKNKFN